MTVMPSNATGWFFHCLARETHRLGHLYSPGQQRGPWPWFPYALDNGCFRLWSPKENLFDEAQWLLSAEAAWRRLLFWAEANNQKALWAIVPDRPGSRDETLRKWDAYAAQTSKVASLACAVQDGMTPEDVQSLDPQPEVVCVGGSTEWKWETAKAWASSFKRTHLLRCNSPARLPDLKAWGFESCDGTGWNRGDRVQTRGLEEFCRGWESKTSMPLWPHVCRQERRANRWCVICACLGNEINPATEVHHIRGRRGALLTDTRFFAASCRSHRSWPHDYPAKAREFGLLEEHV